jgi:DNA transformation protein
MAGLSELPNLGKTVVAELERAGITTPRQLARMGSVGAAVRLVTTGTSVCASKLSALEGAVRGVRWHSIPAEERRALMKRFEARIAKERGSSRRGS